MHLNKIFSLGATAALTLGVAYMGLAPTQGQAGFFSSTMGARLDGSGDTWLSLPDVITGTGITQDSSPLDPDDWFRYRVRVYHADATFPSLGWASDSFPPTGETDEIRICQWAGCDAGEIFVGSESLDWDDDDAITITLEAKSCLLCSWNSYAVN